MPSQAGSLLAEPPSEPGELPLPDGEGDFEAGACHSLALNVMQHVHSLI